MRLHCVRDRRGMTLPELLVVIAILGLLAVAVAPLFNTTKGKRALGTAADLLTAHLNSVASKAIGSRDGGGVWLETDAAGSGGDQAVATLLMARPRLATAGSAVITAVDLSVSPPSATLNITSPIPFPSSLVPLIPESIISFHGIPTRYRMDSQTVIKMLPMYNAENAAFPAVGPTLPFSIQLPPRRKPSASSGLLGNDTCIDFSSSTIGVHGFTPSVSIQSLAASKILAVVFDGVGRATTAWLASDHIASSWTRIDLGPTTPIALLIGNRSQIGQSVASPPTEDDAGPNYQSAESVWVVIDPRTSVIRTVANNPETSLQAAQATAAAALANLVRPL
jgi:prepilin-type N-terminal cleavage/methylation domain-containing protein